MSVSIVIPAYNAEKYLSESVESVQAQTFTDWELIIVDDGSNDETARIAAQFAAQDQRIRYVHQENAGVSAARNRGYLEAGALRPYIIFLDSDDVWDPNALAILVTALEADPCAIASHALSRFIDQDSRIVDSEVSWPRVGVAGGQVIPWPPDQDTVFEVEAVSDSVHPCGTVLIRRAAFERAGLWNTEFRMWEDWDLWLRLCLVGPMRYVEQPVLRYRRHASNVSNDYKGMALGERRVRRRLMKTIAGDPARLRVARIGARYRARLGASQKWGSARESLGRGEYKRSARELLRAIKAYLIYAASFAPLLENMLASEH